MCQSLSPSQSGARYALLFEPLAPSNPSLRFDCNAQGRVELDALSEADLNRYLYARAMVGRAFRKPAVCPLCVGPDCGPDRPVAAERG